MKKWLLAISVLMFGAVFSAGAAEAVYSYSLSWGGLNHPNSVAVDSSGNIYVSDTGNARIEKFDPGGTLPSGLITGIAVLRSRASGIFIRWAWRMRGRSGNIGTALPTMVP
ncbi:MAG: hypothetical protein M0Z48_04960 [Nitrospiraceae bacterium]|nr:hypothetical protein [Nitrospiraceae bacterium]